MPRVKKPARAKGKIGGRARIANGTAGQTQAFSQANPLGSVGFGELLVRTAECETVRKNREGLNNDTPSRSRKSVWAQWTRPGKPFGMQTRIPQNHPECKGRTLREVEGLLE